MQDFVRGKGGRVCSAVGETRKHPPKPSELHHLISTLVFENVIEIMLVCVRTMLSFRRSSIYKL